MFVYSGHSLSKAQIFEKLDRLQSSHNRGNLSHVTADSLIKAVHAHTTAPPRPVMFQDLLDENNNEPLTAAAGAAGLMMSMNAANNNRFQAPDLSPNCVLFEILKSLDDGTSFQSKQIAMRQRLPIVSTSVAQYASTSDTDTDCIINGFEHITKRINLMMLAASNPVETTEKGVNTEVNCHHLLTHYYSN